MNIDTRSPPLTFSHLENRAENALLHGHLFEAAALEVCSASQSTPTTQQQQTSPTTHYLQGRAIHAEQNASWNRHVANDIQFGGHGHWYVHWASIERIVNVLYYSGTRTRTRGSCQALHGGLYVCTMHDDTSRPHYTQAHPRWELRYGILNLQTRFDELTNRRLRTWPPLLEPRIPCMYT